MRHLAFIPLHALDDSVLFQIEARKKKAQHTKRRFISLFIHQYNRVLGTSWKGGYKPNDSIGLNPAAVTECDDVL